MKRFKAAHLSYFVHAMVRADKVALKSIIGADTPLPEADYALLQTVIAFCKPLASEFGLPPSFLKDLERFEALTSKNPVTYTEIQTRAERIIERLDDELERIVFLSLAPGEAETYDNPSPFGEEVADHFPSARDDLEEAGKCLALERGTACVFHLMRAMEIALRVLMVAMGEPYDPKNDSDWTKLLAKCNQHVGTAGPKQAFYRDAVTMLTSVKHSWRNPTMHPKNLYPSGEARDVWGSVRIFMRHLATQLDEKA